MMFLAFFAPLAVFRGRLAGLRRAIGWGALLAVVTACTAPLPFEPTPIDFSYRSVIDMNVRQVNFRDETRNSQQAPEVSHLFPVDLHASIKDWVDVRVAAKGTEGVMTLTLKELSVVEELMPIDQGFVDRLFKREVEASYSARLYMVVESTTPEHKTIRSEIRLSSVDFLLEKPVIGGDHERAKKELWNQMAQRLTRSFDERAEQVLKSDFAPLIVR
ncbi:MAG: hypothetical protein K0U36_04645 [Alphaproteobacteria bacterium]|nr:hypothetical protein [Alphaproteobacteria bacterium]